VKILFEKPGSGKTTKLIEISSKKWFYIVCHSIQEANRIADEAERLGKKIPLPITFHEFLGNSYYSQGIKGFLIDNVDMMIQGMSIVPIHAITLTDPGENIGVSLDG